MSLAKRILILCILFVLIGLFIHSSPSHEVAQHVIELDNDWDDFGWDIFGLGIAGIACVFALCLVGLVLTGVMALVLCIPVLVVGAIILALLPAFLPFLIFVGLIWLIFFKSRKAT